MQIERPTAGALLDAITTRDLARLEALLRDGVRPMRSRIRWRRCESPLVAAALARDREATALLLKHGAPVNELGSAGYSALQIACKHGDLPLAQLLVGHGADARVFKHRPSATALAAFSGNPELVALMLSVGGSAEEVWIGGVSSALRLNSRVLQALAAASKTLPREIAEVIAVVKLADDRPLDRSEPHL